MKGSISNTVLIYIGAAFIIFTFIYPGIHFSDLPDQIPRHYDASGQPDGLSPKNHVWTLPIIGCVMFIAMIFTARIIRFVKDPGEGSTARKEEVIRHAVRLIHLLNLLIAASFAYISFATVQTALGRQEGLGQVFLPALLVLTIGILLYYVYTAANKRS